MYIKCNNISIYKMDIILQKTDCNFIDIPYDTIINIMKRLSLNTLLNFLSTCKYVNDVKINVNKEVILNIIYKNIRISNLLRSNLLKPNILDWHIKYYKFYYKHSKASLKDIFEMIINMNKLDLFKVMMDNDYKLFQNNLTTIIEKKNSITEYIKTLEVVEYQPCKYDINDSCELNIRLKNELKNVKCLDTTKK